MITQLNTQTPEHQLALFLHAIGPEALTIYNGFDYTAEEDKSKVETVIKKFDEHFVGETNETYERYLFNKRVQEPNESIDTYITALKIIAKTCNFCQCLHDSLIRDQIVVGVRDNTVRKRLLQERKLTLNHCIDTCRGAEATTSRLKGECSIVLATQALSWK